MIGTIIALASREARRDLFDRGRLLFDIAWPLMILIVLGFGVDAFAPPKAGLSYVAFLGPGVIGLLIMRQAVAFGRSLEKEARYGYREYLVTPVRRHLIILGSFIGKATVQSLLAVGVLLVYCVATNNREIHTIAWGAGATIVSVWTGLSIGLALSIAVRDLRLYPRSLWLSIIALGLISGIFFPIDDLPFGLSYLSYASPLTYMVDSIRGAIIGVSVMDPVQSLGITSILLGICLGGSLWKSDTLFRV